MLVTYLPACFARIYPFQQHFWLCVSRQVERQDDAGPMAVLLVDIPEDFPLLTHMQLAMDEGEIPYALLVPLSSRSTLQTLILTTLYAEYGSHSKYSHATAILIRRRCD